MRVLGATRTRTAVVLSDVTPTIGLRAHESRHPVPTRATCLTRARPQPCAAASSWPPWPRTRKSPAPEAGGSAKFPQWPSSTGGGSRTRMGLTARHFLRVLCIPFHHARLRAPPEARTPFPGLRVQCITSHACGALERLPGNAPGPSLWKSDVHLSTPQSHGGPRR